jgi:hypothetical protein
MKKTLLILLTGCLSLPALCQQIITGEAASSAFSIVQANSATPICVDITDHVLVTKSAAFFQQDIEMITGKKPDVLKQLPASAKQIIIIGSLDRSPLIQRLAKQKKINISSIKGKWEAYSIQVVNNPVKGIEKALVIVGSDRRGTAFGVFELSRQMGVSPWYWWADVPVKKKPVVHIKRGITLSDAPKVKYRGIFINDEAPALSGWSREKFGGFNRHFYEKVFELMLRLKSNYLWPAMWGNAFYDDDSLNIKAADDYGIVIGTSHHEPLMRAHDEWRRYGKGQKWNYDSTEAGLKAFWKGGMQRATNEKIVSIGMRGDGDEPMTRETATSLLERIVKDQRSIIEEVTGKPASETPQLWALYKEVQDYYDKGMRVPDDVTLLLCDDNWGNIRKLPRLDEKPRKGGYGIYYHFDYVGGPRNYKWVNTNPIPRVWEQMHLAWEYNARQIWIVNVGDIKPMEFPISFFLDYAWNPEKTGPTDLQLYTEKWTAEQFGPTHATKIAEIISKYSKYNGRRKPELLDANTYHPTNYGELARVGLEQLFLHEKAMHLEYDLPEEYRDAYFQLVLHPVWACSNLQQLYAKVAFNRLAASQRQPITNRLADEAKELYKLDSFITLRYHQIRNGKWNHMMSQAHIGYTNWQQPPQQTMPVVTYIAADSTLPADNPVQPQIKSAEALMAPFPASNTFYELNGYSAIEASNYSRAINTNGITWQLLPDHGRTGSAITPFPVTALPQTPGNEAPHLQYDVYVYDTGSTKLQAYFSPTLNFHSTAEGLQYAISIDDEQPQIISINKEDNNVGTWSRWVANNIIIKTTDHHISKPGKHIVKYWMVHPGVVLQKLVVDFGGVRPSYLGPPETKR